MNALPTYSEWFRRMTLPLLALFVLSMFWSAFTNLVMYRALRVYMTHVGGAPLSFIEELTWRIPSGIVLVFLIGFTLLSVLAVLKRQFRWWLVALALFVIGSPVAIAFGRVYLPYLWRTSAGAIEEEDLYPVPLGFVVAWVAALVADWLLDRYQRRRREQRAAAVLCPSCGYDLRGTIAAGSTKCSECGEPFELVRIELPNASDDVRSAQGGLAARRPGGTL
jgi:hypothetical protein